MIKSFKLLCLAPVLGIGLILGGCGGSGGDAANNSGEAQVIELKYADFHTTAMDLGRIHEQALKMVEEKTNGQVKMVPYFGGTLIGSNDTYKGVATGVADIALFLNSTTPGVQPLDQVFKLPLGFANQEQANLGYEQVLEKFPQIQEENEKAGVRWLAVGPMPAYTVNMVKKPVRVPDDFKGENVKAAAIFARAVTSGGGGVTDVPPGDVYSAAEKGVISGQICPLLAIVEFKTDEVFKYHTILEPEYSVYGYMGFLINLATWEKLSPDIQQALVESFQWACDERARINKESVQKTIDNYKNQPDHTVIELTVEEAKQWADITNDYVAEWIKDTTDRGWPAREVYDGARAIAAQLDK